MKRACLVLAGFALSSTLITAQGPPSGPTGIAAGLQRNYAFVKMLLTQAAEKMPEADYAFKPTPDIRTYGQIFGHVANAQFGQCSEVRGIANPNAATNFEQKTAKADVVKALADSFAVCDPAFASLTDQNAVEMISGRGGQAARAVALMGVLDHGSEMYGISTVYLRLKGLVPPGTEMMQRGRGPGRGRQ